MDSSKGSGASLCPGSRLCCPRPTRAKPIGRMRAVMQLTFSIFYQVGLAIGFRRIRSAPAKHPGSAAYRHGGHWRWPRTTRRPREDWLVRLQGRQCSDLVAQMATNYSAWTRARPCILVLSVFILMFSRGATGNLYVHPTSRLSKSCGKLSPTMSRRRGGVSPPG